MTPATDRALGLLLFLPVPVVLVLFTRAPLGIAWSLLLGIAIMISHRLYARPFARARAARRCLWCGGIAAAAGPRFAVEEPGGPSEWRACSPAHEDRLRRFLGWAGSHRRFLQVGILGTLVTFLAAAAWIAARGAGPVAYADAVSAFRLGIAACVLPLALLPGRAVAGDEPPRVPFPVHIQALVGTWAVAWLFRIVGAAWLVLALLHFARRL